jgi:hypothetical protein
LETLCEGWLARRGLANPCRLVVSLTVFDELLNTIGHVKVAPFVYVDNITCLEPAIFRKGGFIDLWSIPVSEKHVRALKQQLSLLLQSQSHNFDNRVQCKDQRTSPVGTSLPSGSTIFAFMFGNSLPTDP